MRFSRLVIGVLIIVGAIWVIVTEQMAGASADAVLNAQIVEVRSPIAGIVEDTDRVLGSAVAAGDPLSTVASPNVDAVRLDDLTLERERALIRRDALEGQKESLAQEIDRLSDRSAQYNDYSVQDLSAALAEAQERLRLMVEAAPGAEADQIRVSLAREEAARLQIALTAAREGVFIRGGYNDAPFTEQKVIEHQQTLIAVTLEIESLTAEIDALTRRIDKERIRVGKFGIAALTAPIDGLVWERIAVNGSHVERGDLVLRLADCHRTIVTLSVTQSVFNRLRPGSPATFRFDGSGEVFSGTVTRLAGTSAAGFYRSLAVAPSERHLERADVAVILPGLADHPDLRCAIGRTGRAYFEVRPLDWLRSSFQ